MNKFFKFFYSLIGVTIISAFVLHYLKISDLHDSHFKSSALLVCFYALISFLSFKKKWLALQLFCLINLSFLGDAFIRVTLVVSLLQCLIQLPKVSGRLPQNYLIFYLGFIISIFGSLIITTRYDVDPILIQDSFFIGGLGNLFSQFENLTSFLFWPYVNFLDLTLTLTAPLIWLLTYDQTYFRKSLTLAIKYTLPFSATVLIIQKYFINTFFYINYNDLWKILGRFPANFIDPNSFGVILGLFILFLYFEHSFKRLTTSAQEVVKPKNIFQYSNLLFILGFFILGLFSGSRTFFLIVFLGVLSSIKNLSFRNSAAVVFPIIVCGIVAFFNYESLPIGVSRLLDTLTPAKTIESLYSRAIYTRIGIQAINDNLLNGVGQGRFFFVQNEIAEKIGISLGVWRDNANNFYLQAGAEGGIICIILTIFSIACLLWKNHTQEASGLRKILIIFFVAMLTGPHLNSPDVRIFVLILMTLYLAEIKSFELGFSRWLQWSFICVASLYLCLQIFHTPKSLASISKGFYKIEDNNSERYRWTGSHGRLVFCNPETSTPLSFKNLNPKENIAIRFGEDGEWKEIQSGTSIKISTNPMQEFLNFKIKNPWSPKDALNSADSRILGLALDWPGNSDCF